MLYIRMGSPAFLVGFVGTVVYSAAFQRRGCMTRDVETLLSALLLEKLNTDLIGHITKKSLCDIRRADR